MHAVLGLSVLIRRVKLVDLIGTPIVFRMRLDVNLLGACMLTTIALGSRVVVTYGLILICMGVVGVEVGVAVSMIGVVLSES